MKKFIIRFFIFLVPILIMGVFIEVVTRSIPNEYKYKNNYLNKFSNQIEVLVLGSSHTYYGINPDYFTLNTFNSAHVSQTVDFDYFILNKFIEDLSSLKVVIIPISYFSLFSRLEEGLEAYRAKNYTIYYGYKDSNALNYFEVSSGQILKKIKRIIKYSFFGIDATISKKGFGLSKLKKEPIDYFIKDGKIAATRHSKGKWENVVKNKKNIEKIIMLCQKKQIKVIFVTLPAYRSYRENIDDERLLYTTNYLNKVSKTYNNVTYYNFLADARFVVDDYMNADHFNSNGAKKLSKIINNLIKKSS